MFVAQTIIPIFLLILIGVAMRRWFGLREDFWPQLDRLIYYVFFPALLFSTLSHFKIGFGAATPMLMVATLYIFAASHWAISQNICFMRRPRCFRQPSSSHFASTAMSASPLPVACTVRRGLPPSVC